MFGMYLVFSRWGILSLYFYGMVYVTAESAIHAYIYICVYGSEGGRTADGWRTDGGQTADRLRMDDGWTVDTMYGFPKLVCMVAF